MEHKIFRHVSEEERVKAQEMWNEFHGKLSEMGLKLFYDYHTGGFFVASEKLTGSCYGLSEEEDTLTKSELEEIIDEGGFDGKASCNPPWFTDRAEYTLCVKED